MKFTKGNTVGLLTRFGDQWEGVRCGAKTRSGFECQRPAYKRNGKCHLHGGASTGPRTEAGLARLTESRTKHGLKYIYYEVVCTPKFKPEVCNFYMLEPTSSEKYSQAILVEKGREVE